MRAIIADIDGTLADLGGRRSWHGPAELMPCGSVLRDGSIPWWLQPDILRAMVPREIVWHTLYGLMTVTPYRDAALVFVTGRRESMRAPTEEWLDLMLRRYGMSVSVGASRLLMRQDGDERVSHLVKEDIFHQMLTGSLRPEIAFEDRHDDAAMYRRHGLTVFHLEDAPAAKAKPAKPEIVYREVDRSPDRVLPPMDCGGPLA